MKKSVYIFLVLILIAVTLGIEKPSYAASQDECAIWLCLPGGFAQGCGAAHSAMIKRIKKRKPPLPSFGSCSEGGSGNYKMGYEPFEPCKQGFELNIDDNNERQARCVSNNVYQFCRNQTGVEIQFDNNTCYYKAIKRPKPYFVEMWVSGGYLGKFFYQ